MQLVATTTLALTLSKNPCPYIIFITDYRSKMKIFSTLFFTSILDSVCTTGSATGIRSHVIADDSKTCLSPGDYEDYDWYEMSTEAIEAAVALGYSQVSWDLSSVPASFLLPWSALSDIQRVASMTLGCDAQCWDHCYIDGSTIGGFDRSLFDDSECVTRPFEDSYWDDMEEDTHEYLVVLGYSQVVWDMEGLSPKEDYLWTDLTSEEKAAGVGLGYNETSWMNCINQHIYGFTSCEWLTLASEVHVAGWVLEYVEVCYMALEIYFITKWDLSV